LLKTLQYIATTKKLLQSFLEGLQTASNKSKSFGCNLFKNENKTKKSPIFTRPKFDLAATKSQKRIFKNLLLVIFLENSCNTFLKQNVQLFRRRRTGTKFFEEGCSKSAAIRKF